MPVSITESKLAGMANASLPHLVSQCSESRDSAEPGGLRSSSYSATPVPLPGYSSFLHFNCLNCKKEDNHDMVMRITRVSLCKTLKSVY